MGPSFMIPNIISIVLSKHIRFLSQINNALVSDKISKNVSLFFYQSKSVVQRHKSFYIIISAKCSFMIHNCICTFFVWVKIKSHLYFEQCASYDTDSISTSQTIPFVQYMPGPGFICKEALRILDGRMRSDCELPRPGVGCRTRSGGS